MYLSIVFSEENIFHPASLKKAGTKIAFAAAFFAPPYLQALWRMI